MNPARRSLTVLWHASWCTILAMAGAWSAERVEQQVVVPAASAVVCKAFMIQGRDKGVEHRLAQIVLQRRNGKSSVFDIGECHIYAGKTNPCSAAFFADHGVLMVLVAICGRTETYYLHGSVATDDVHSVINAATKPHWSETEKGIVLSEADDAPGLGPAALQVVIRFLGGADDQGDQQKTPAGANGF